MSVPSTEVIEAKRGKWAMPRLTMHGGAPSIAIRSDATERPVSREGLKWAFIVWLVFRFSLPLWGAFTWSVPPADSHAHILRDYPDVVLPDHDLYGYTVGV